MCFAARQKSTAALLRVPLAGVGELAVHPDAFNASGDLDRIIKGSCVDDLFRIEKNEVGIVAFVNLSSLGETESLRGHACHLMNRFR